MTYRVLFVCLGNICRSPLAEGTFRHLVEEAGLGDRIEIDSAGTGAWHVGEGPDPRSVEVAERHGVSLDGQTARRVTEKDFQRFDRIVAMDADNRSDLMTVAPAGSEDKVCMLRDFDPAGPGDVPDPYFGGDQGFENAFDMIHRSCSALLDEIEAERRR